jgi:hypothetical protein
MSVTNQKAKKINYLKAKKSNHLNELTIKIITFLALGYLVYIPFGSVTNRFELTDLAMIVIILLFNSDLPERLQELGVNKDGITFKLNKLEAQQENQRANVKANTEVIQRLTKVERASANNKQEKRLVVKTLLTDYELQHLKKLASDTAFPYQKRRVFQQELRHLRALGFIEVMPKQHISSISEQGDLRDYVKITEQGKEYLQLKEELESAERSDPADQ